MNRPKIDRHAAEVAIAQFLTAIGSPPSSHPDLEETPKRVTEAYIDDLLDGVSVDVDAMVASQVVVGKTGLVVVRGLSVTTMCPHHLLPASGSATVAFAPSEKLVGIGVLGQLVDALAHRLTLQETLGEEVVSTLVRHLSPRWAACRLTLSHGCMTARGARKHGAAVETLAFRGEPNDNVTAMAALGFGVSGA